MQSPTGQYGTQAGDPAQPVQHSVMTASSFGFFFRGVMIPSDFGSLLTTVAVMIELCHRGRRLVEWGEWESRTYPRYAEAEGVDASAHSLDKATSHQCDRGCR